MRAEDAVISRLFVAEEQQILREAFRSFFENHPQLELVGVSEDTSGESLRSEVRTLAPDVVLLGVRMLEGSIANKLETIREHRPDAAVVLLYAQFDVEGIRAVREFTRSATAGCAYLLKHTVNTMAQLAQTIESAVQGRMILDPSVMQGLIVSPDAGSQFLGQLTPREMEVLNWMAQGYKNAVIANVMCLEPKTVEKHINGIYAKLGANTDADARHMRVFAVTRYLQAIRPQTANADAGSARIPAVARMETLPGLQRAA